EVSFSAVAEAGARREQDAGLVEDARDEVRGGAAGRDPAPEVERAAGRLDRTPETLQPLERDVATLAVEAAKRRAVAWKDGRETPRGGDLDRLRGARVEVGLEANERVDQVRRADREAETPARHVERLRERVEFDGALARSGDLQDARRRR